MNDVTARLRAAGCVFAEEEARLLREAAGSAGDLDRMVRLRMAGHPLEHVLGWAEFRGLRIVVHPGVFVPRRRTELLVEHARRLLAHRSILVDMCCGTGAVAAALAREVAGVEVYACDLDPRAVECARVNLGPLGATVSEGDLFEALPARLRQRVDVLVANVPYVPSDEIARLPPEARQYEPRHALDGGPDGLATLRRVARGAADWLRPGGSLLVETAAHQAPGARAAFAAAGLEPVVVTDDARGATAVLGRRGRAAPAFAPGRPGHTRLQRPPARRQTTRRGPAVSTDAITLLKADHKDVKRLFRKFEQAGEEAHATKGRLVEAILEALTVHTYIENEVMYPEVRRLLPEVEDDVLESYEEHHVADVLCMELAAMSPDAERYDAKTSVLIELVEHHIDEEEDEWFPKVREALGRKPLQEIGEQLLAAKARAPRRPEQPGALKKVVKAVVA